MASGNRKIRAVRAAQPVKQPSHSQAGTLGEVLYAGGQEASLILEEDWVRLVRAIAAGDQLALHGLYERTHRVVFTLMVRITASRETAEELTVDVFHDVWQRASRYEPANGTVLGWIMNQARSRAIDRVRFETRKKRVNPDDNVPLPPVESPDSQVLLEFKRQGQSLRAALEVLTPDERQAIEAAFFSGLTYAEVAERSNVPLGTVKTRIRAGLQKLRQALGPDRNAL